MNEAQTPPRALPPSFAWTRTVALGSVLGIAAATAVFAALHDPGHDAALFGGIFLGLAAVAAVAVPTGQRIRT